MGQYQTKVPKDGVRINKYDSRQHSDLKTYLQYLDSINTVEVFAKARVPHGPEVKGVRELKAYLLKERKDDIVENVVRRLLSYGVGRHLTYRDRFAVEAIIDQTQKSGFGMRDIIVSICKSEVFRESASNKKD